MFGFYFYVFGQESPYLPLRSASRLAKAFMNTSTNMLAPENCAGRMRDTSIMFTKSFRDMDDRAAQIAALLVPAAQRTTPEKKLGGRRGSSVYSKLVIGITTMQPTQIRLCSRACGPA